MALIKQPGQKIITVDIDPQKGVTADNIAAIASALKLDGAARKDAETVFPLLYKAFTEKDMSLLEVNPLIVMKDGHLFLALMADGGIYEFEPLALAKPQARAT